MSRRASRDPVVTNQPDAERVADYARAFVSILFSDDPRVRALYLSWRDAVTRRELGVTVRTVEDVERLCIDDVAQIRRTTSGSSFKVRSPARTGRSTSRS